MEFGKLVSDSFGYARDGLVGHYGKWIMLIILAILPVIPMAVGITFGIVALFSSPDLLWPVIAVAVVMMFILALPLLGYMVRVYRGENPAPEVNNWGALFSDGLKLFVVLLIYAIPVIIIAIVLIGSVIMALLPYAPQLMDPMQSAVVMNSLMGMIGAALFGIIILVLVAFILWLIEATAVVRFARTNSIGEAFNFGEIFARIGKIGVGSYIVALIIQAIIVGIIVGVLEFIPYIGYILVIVITPILTLFQTRYLSLLYDSAGTA